MSTGESILLQSNDLLELKAQFESRNPTEINFLRPNGFKFIIHNLPKVTYFCQAANIPEMRLGVAEQSTPLVDIPRPGEKITFGVLTIQFMIQEDLANYNELYQWIIGLGFPSSREQFLKYGITQAYRFPDQNYSTDLGEYSDASLIILGSDNNPIGSINFHDCFPVSLSGLEFNTTGTDMQYFQAQAEFRYRQFDLERYTTTT